MHEQTAAWLHLIPASSADITPQRPQAIREERNTTPCTSLVSYSPAKLFGLCLNSWHHNSHILSTLGSNTPKVLYCGSCVLKDNMWLLFSRVAMESRPWIWGVRSRYIISRLWSFSVWKWTLTYYVFAPSSKKQFPLAVTCKMPQKSTETVCMIYWYALIHLNLSLTILCAAHINFQYLGGWGCVSLLKWGGKIYIQESLAELIAHETIRWLLHTNGSIPVSI